MMDVGRSNFLADLGAFGPLKEHGWYPVVAVVDDQVPPLAHARPALRDHHAALLGWDARVRLPRADVPPRRRARRPRRRRRAVPRRGTATASRRPTSSTCWAPTTARRPSCPTTCRPGPRPSTSRTARPPDAGCRLGLSRGEPLQQQRLGEHDLLQLAQVHRLVRAVRAAVGVLDAGDQDRRVGVDLEQVGDERDRPADADVDRLGPPRLRERPAGRLHRRRVERRLERLALLAVGHGHAGAERRVLDQVACAARPSPRPGPGRARAAPRAWPRRAG